MKNMIYIALLSVFLYGCSYDMSATMHADTVSEEAKIENKAVWTEGKTKVDTVSLKEAAVFKMDMVDGEFEYEVIAAETFDYGTAQSFSIYLAEKDSAVAYKQYLMDEELDQISNDIPMEIYPLNNGKKSILAVAFPEDTNHSAFKFLTVQNGELRMVHLKEKVANLKGLEPKIIQNNYLQTAFIKDNGDSVVYKTWKLNDDASEFIFHDQSEVTASKARLDKWKENDAYYYPFFNIEISTDLIEKAKQGIPIGSPFPLGTNISEIKKADPNFMEDAVVADGPYLLYPEIKYFYELGSGKVESVSIPGARLDVTLEEAMQTLGQPESTMMNPHSGMTALYFADKYIVQIAGDSDGKVEEIILKRNTK